MKQSLIIAILFACTITASAEVVLVRDGTLYLGKVTSIDATHMVMDCFGKQEKIPTGTILSNLKDVSALKNSRNTIVLKDDTHLSGTIENFDDEIGVLINIGFGTLTIPVNSIKTIYNAAQRKYHLGATFKFGGTISLQKVTGDLQDDFSLFPRFSLYAEFMLRGARGLFAGVDFSFRAMGNAASGDLSYRTFSLRPYLMLSWLDFRKMAGLFSRMTPYVSLHAGAAYTTLEDRRSYVTSNIINELNIEGALGLGFDIRLNGTLSLRLGAEYARVFQKNSSYADLSFMLGVNYGL